MKRINKKDMERYESLKSELQEQHGKLQDSVTEALAAFNEKREELYNFLDDLASEAQNYFDDRSEKWQEGDAGGNYQSWMDALAERRDSLEEMEIEVPDMPELDDLPASPEEC